MANYRILQKGAAMKGNAFGSFKYAGKSVLCYELGVDILAGNLVWVWGPYPTGKYTDIAILHSLRVGWRNLVRVSLIFAIIVSFMLLFRRIFDSRFKWIHDFEENWTESVGPVPFSAEHLICRYVQTDGRINPGWAG